jgi:hypothetical protein
MGTWGPGNFENDTAAEYLIGLCKPIVEQIRASVAQPQLMQPDEPDSEVMLANVEILSVLGSSIGKTKDDEIGRMIFPFPLPFWEEVEQWKQEYLKVWDANIDKLTGGDFKTRRRRVIVDTFERLIAVSKSGPPLKGVT